MNEQEVRVIQRYVDEVLFEPHINWPKYEFKDQSYSRWAAYEILNLIMDHPFTEASITVEEFMLKMDYFYALAGNDEKARFLFTSARHTAETIFDLIC